MSVLSSTKTGYYQSRLTHTIMRKYGWVKEWSWSCFTKFSSLIGGITLHYMRENKSEFLTLKCTINGKDYEIRTIADLLQLEKEYRIDTSIGYYEHT